ncbi:MAG: hypothetical protein WBG71_04855 [Leeuwenhoekiella sp.]
MAGREVIWSSRAKRELRKTLLFFNERNGNTRYSKKLLSEIEDGQPLLKMSGFWCSKFI